MAKQAGYIKLEGTIGDLSFYKSRDGNFIARRKGGVTKKRLMTDPKFQRTRGKHAGIFQSCHRSQIPQKRLPGNLIILTRDFSLRKLS